MNIIEQAKQAVVDYEAKIESDRIKSLIYKLEKHRDHYNKILSDSVSIHHPTDGSDPHLKIADHGFDLGILHPHLETCHSIENLLPWLNPRYEVKDMVSLGKYFLWYDRHKEYEERIGKQKKWGFFGKR